MSKPKIHWLVFVLVLCVFVLVGMGQHRRAADPKTIYQALLTIDNDCTRVEQALIRAGGSTGSKREPGESELQIGSGRITWRTMMGRNPSRVAIPLAVSPSHRKPL